MLKKMLRLSILLLFLRPFLLPATEGMWLPTLLKSIEGNMQAAGLKLSAEDIYSINNGSIKDAVVLFGGGCTAEVISGQGLILTNHHCGFGQIAEHSTLENDYLKNGFWAANKGAELRNQGLTATFVVRMEDVTDRILAGLDPSMNETQRRDAIKKASEPITKEAVEGTHYQAVVRPFNYGNSYYLIVTETYRDVRLVGAPPSSIGKFGGDTDNWMWPRHNADFSIFRIYAGPDNKPADPADVNVPFTPRHILPISLDGVKEGDFAMIFGFPGNTQQYLSSFAVKYVVEKSDPMRIQMRSASLEVIDDAMRRSDVTRLQYADKQSSISNAYKKWIGELRGLKALNTIETKQQFEEEFIRKAKQENRKEAAIIDELKGVYDQYIPYAMARDLFIEMVYYGPEILRFADRAAILLEEYDELAKKDGVQKALDDLKSGIDPYFKDYDVEVDRKVFKALLPIYLEHIDPSLAPAILQQINGNFKGDTDAWVDDLYARSVFDSKQELEAALKGLNAKKARKLREDPAFKAARDFMNTFTAKVRPTHVELSDRIEASMRSYLKARMELFPDRVYWPDANSTLRLSYGHVEGSMPRDAVVYDPHTTLDGVIAKYVPGDVEFDVPERLLELHTAKDFGEYGVNGTMPVCFTSSLHTTGGNSGSPVLNGKGELIGINFDRTWESTMSDIEFDPEKCRNISVDVRYILFIVDKFANAKHLVDEMQVVRFEVPSHVIELPIHR
jgi:hypothetical protein